jgi:hypothetical protein
MSANKSPTICPAGFFRAPALRPRISVDSRDLEARQWRNSAPLRCVKPQGEKGTPPPRSNFSETKLRGPLESTKACKKEAKTKLSEAEKTWEALRAPRTPRTRGNPDNTCNIIRLEGTQLTETSAAATRTGAQIGPDRHGCDRENGGRWSGRRGSRIRGYKSRLSTGTRQNKGKAKKGVLKNEGKRTHRLLRISNLFKNERRSEPTEILCGRVDARLKRHEIRCLGEKYHRRRADIYIGRVRPRCAQAIHSPLLLDFARADAGRANQNCAPRAVDQGMDAPQVRLPAPLGDVVGVADPVSERRTLAADFTGVSHC